MLPDSLLSECKSSLLLNCWCFTFYKGIIQDQRILEQNEDSEGTRPKSLFHRTAIGTTCWASLGLGPVCGFAIDQKSPSLPRKTQNTSLWGDVFY